MKHVVNVRLHGCGKPERFDVGELTLRAGDFVVVEADQGLDFGVVVATPTASAADDEVLPFVVRVASDHDLTHYDDNVRDEAEAFTIGSSRIERLKLPMTLIDVQYRFDNRKLTFYFMSDGRVDFRELVKDLAAIFHVRIELRQIGVRDEARHIGGLGQCGRELCCGSFLRHFHPVTIKMVKEQNVSMNPQKISGACGRLLCCLSYEQEAYVDVNARMPSRHSLVKTPLGHGVVVGCQLLKERVQVRLDGDEGETMWFSLSDVDVLAEAKAKKRHHR